MWKQAFLVIAGIALSYWFLWNDKLDTLKGKRVLVTGASEGIGEQLAYHYARYGASVVVTARRLEKLNKVVKECQSLSPSPNTKHFAVSADMLKLDDTSKVINQAVKYLGGLDVLVLNHITSNFIRPFIGSQEQLDEFNRIIDINFKSYVYLTSHALPQLKANNGSIVVVNSLVGKVPQLYLASYCSSKHALTGFFNALKNEFTSQGQDVSVTSCYLGYIGTDNSLRQMESIAKDSIAKYLVPASPNDTALDIVIAGARRADRVYTPSFSRLVAIVYSIWPAPMEYLTSSMFSSV